MSDLQGFQTGDELAKGLLQFAKEQKWLIALPQIIPQAIFDIQGKGEVVGLANSVKSGRAHASERMRW